MAKNLNIVSILKTQHAFLEKEKERIDKELNKLNDALAILDTGEEEEAPRRGRKRKSDSTEE